MTTTLTPGTPVWHPDHGYGIVAIDCHQELRVWLAMESGLAWSATLDGFAPIRVVRPGEFAVRVDDIAEWIVEGWGDAKESAFPWGTSQLLAIRAAKAIQAQRDQATPPATPETLPTETVVRLACPECGDAVEAAAVVEECGDGYSVVYPVSAPQPGEPDHVCKPTIPDEPTEPGARWTLDGKRCVRDASPKGRLAWLDVDSIGDWCSWDNFTSHVEGWGE